MITIRQMQPRDWELFKSLRLTALADAPYAFDETLDEAKRMSDHEWKAMAELNSEGQESICALAFFSEEPIGMAAGFLDHDDKGKANLVATWIDPRFRGRGIAEGLIRFISDWANIAGVEVLAADVNMHNPRAQAFYRKIGFKLLDDPHTLSSGPTKSQVPIRKILRIKERHGQLSQALLKGDVLQSIEKRKDTRKDCLIAITFSFEDRAYTEFIRNISQRGMYIESDVKISEGKALTLSYDLPETGPFKCIGKVVWVNPEGMGVRLQ